MKKIFKVAGIEIKNDKFLMVRKTGKDIWTNLGGKPEGDESSEEALRREVKEELGCGCEIIEYLGEFENRAALDDAIINIKAFVIKLNGEPKISDQELEEYRYIDQKDIEQGIKLPLSVSRQLIPELIKKQYLKWIRE